MGKYIRINFATITGSIVPLNDPTSGPASFTADTTLDEESILGEPSLRKPTGRRGVSHTGNVSSVIQNLARDGTRDLILMDGHAMTERLQYFAMKRPGVHFNFDFQYALNAENKDSGRIHQHFDCFIENQPVREINNDTLMVRFTLNYHELRVVDAATGQLVGST